MRVTHHVHSKNQTWVLCRSSSQPLSHLSNQVVTKYLISKYAFSSLVACNLVLRMILVAWGNYLIDFAPEKAPFGIFKMIFVLVP